MTQAALDMDTQDNSAQGNEFPRQISPLRNTTDISDPKQLAAQQLEHFGIDASSDYGKAMQKLTETLYNANQATHELWQVTMDSIGQLNRSDRQAYFNAKRFACFQLAKILDSMQNPLRRTYQSLTTEHGGFACKGSYPLFDNVAAIFSATPVVTRTATYLFACSEWVEDAFKGREPLHEIYSRLLNPTSISLANHIVDLEAGPLAPEYLAWNFNSGMAAIDATIAHLVGYEDIILSSRNTYGGTFQLFKDWYGKHSNLNVGIEWFDGFTLDAFKAAYEAAKEKYADRLAKGRKIYVYIESPCNPHGNVLDVPAISKFAHENGSIVICDATVGTPFLQPTLQREDPTERPDFVIHSYTKDLAGSGATTAGVCIGRTERMFIPKGDHVTIKGVDGKDETIDWEDSMFWNVYYIKGAFLDSDKAFEVMNGMRTYELRVLQKCINTTVLATLLNRHPSINVNCPALEGHYNNELMKKQLFLGLPAPLFTIDMEGNDKVKPVNRDAFKRFFDALEPGIGMQVSLGQTNTVALCPALTSHSELPEAALKEAGIEYTTTRISVGLEDPRSVLAHIINACKLCIEPFHKGFCDGFPSAKEIDEFYHQTYIDIHKRYAEQTPGFEELAA